LFAGWVTSAPPLALLHELLGMPGVGDG
jgi:hypothetical protein